MRALLRLLRWLLALPLRILGNGAVRIGGLLAITAAFLAWRPMDPAFYGVSGGFLAISVLARPLGRLLTPKPRPKQAPMPPLLPRAAAPAEQVVTPPPPPRPAVPFSSRRPMPSLVALAVPPADPHLAPDEAAIRARLPAQLQALLSGLPAP